jgi:hypothetical protein
MAIVADFVQFSDSPVSLVIGGDIDRAFTKNIDATPVSGEGAVVKWMVWRGGTGSVTYEVRVNGAAINTYTVTLADRVAVHETISTDNIHLGDNTVVFEVKSGTATLSFADVILLYRQNT